MKRGKCSVYYDTSTEGFLEYDGPRFMYYYVQNGLKLDDLPHDDLVLLKHMREFMRFVEDFVFAIYDQLDECEQVTEGLSALSLALMNAEREERQKQKNDPPLPAVGEVLGMAWYWHKLVRARGKSITGLYAKTLLLSWSGYCKLFHLYVTSDTERCDKLRTMVADDFTYFRLVSEETNALVSEDRIARYKLSEIWAAMRRIAPSTYVYTFSAEMKEYVHALFFRYCDVFCSMQDNGLDEVLDHARFYAHSPVSMEVVSSASGGDGSEQHLLAEEHYDAYRDTTVRLSDQYVLKSEYFYEGELLFFFQLQRLRLCEDLIEQYEQNPIILKRQVSDDQLKQCNTALLEMLTKLVVHASLKKYIVEDFKVNVLSLHLYHGETERYQRRNPTASATPGDVLMTSRPIDYELAIGVRQATLGELIKGLHEREIIMITMYATTRWLALSEVSQSKRIAQCFVIEELHSVHALEQLVAKNEEGNTDVPVLLKLVHIYYVLHKGAVYKSRSFIDVYMTWLATLVHRTDLVRLDQIHELIKDLLAIFISV